MDFDGIPSYVLDLSIKTLEGFSISLRNFLLEELNEDIETSKWVVEADEESGISLAMLNLTTPTRNAALVTTPAGCFLIKNERRT